MDFDASATTLFPKTDTRRGSLSPPPWATATGSGRSRGSSHEAFRLSKHPQPSTGLDNPFRRTPSPPVDNEFADRFKYLVATSGLLEKTQLASLAAPASPIAVGGERADCEQVLDPSTASDAAPESAPDSAAEVPRTGVLLRWDILAALGVLVVALFVALGLRVGLGVSVAILAGVALYSYQVSLLSASTANS